MNANDPQKQDDPAALQIRSGKPVFKRLTHHVPDWRPAAKRAAGAIAAVAAVGAVLGGLVGFWSTYKVVVGEWLGQKPAVVSQAKTDAPAAFNPPRLSIALMPFDNLSGDASQDYFGDGIVENLTTELSVNIANLLVIARGAAFSYKGQKVDSKQAGRELNVRYLLQGSVLRADKSVRINARLIDAVTGEQVWADRFDGDTSNIIALQDRVTGRISSSLHVALITAGARQAQTRNNPDAFDMILRARAALNDERRLNINPRRQTEEYYRRALALDADNVDAVIGLAGVLGENLMNTRSLPPAARPGSDQVTATRAEILGLLQKASTKVDSSDARVARSHLYLYDNKLDDARRELERALAIDPNNNAVMFNLAINYNLSGMPERALPLFNEFHLRTAGKTPAYRAAVTNWGSSYLLLGRWNEAVEKLEQARALFADPGVAGLLAVALVKSGKVDAARGQYEIFHQWHNAKYAAPPTVKRLKDDASKSSQVPEYLKLYDATVLDGLRNLGMPEE